MDRSDLIVVLIFAFGVVAGVLGGWIMLLAVPVYLVSVVLYSVLLS